MKQIQFHSIKMAFDQIQFNSNYINSYNSLDFCGVQIQFNSNYINSYNSLDFLLSSNSNVIQFYWIWLNINSIEPNSIQFGLQPMKFMGIVPN